MILLPRQDFPLKDPLLSRGPYFQAASHRDTPQLLLFRMCTATHCQEPSLHALRWYQPSRHRHMAIKFLFTIALRM